MVAPFTPTSGVDHTLTAAPVCIEPIEHPHAADRRSRRVTAAKPAAAIVSANRHVLGISTSVEESSIS
jgi:hypothetical protein